MLYSWLADFGSGSGTLKISNVELWTQRFSRLRMHGFTYFSLRLRESFVGKDVGFGIRVMARHQSGYNLPIQATES